MLTSTDKLKLDFSFCKSLCALKYNFGHSVCVAPKQRSDGLSELTHPAMYSPYYPYVT